MSARLLLIVAAMAVSLPAGAASDGSEAFTYRSTQNLEMVAQIPGGGGTDLEFFSRTLSAYKDASGEMIEVDPPVERHFSLVGNSSSGPKVVDITEPERPYIASVVPSCAISQGDTQVNKAGTLAVIAKQGGGTCRTVTNATLTNGSAIVDLSDVYAPKVVGRATESAGSHNNTLHPGGRYLYISTSTTTPNSGANTRIPIFDLADPSAPRKVKDWLTPGNGPHDIRFSEDGTRAYLAGVSTFRIVDTTDPENPVLISSIVPPVGTIGHDTLITRDKRFLFLGDEANGGGTYPCPGGAIYAYDLTDERAPVLLGVAEAGGGPVTARNHGEAPGPTTTGGCTSHVMDLNPDGVSLTIGWYRLGTRVFDFSSFYNTDGSAKPAAGISAAWGEGTGLVETAWIVPDGANTWAAKQYAKVPGYIFSDDTTQGFYVSRIRGAAPGRRTKVTALEASPSGTDTSVSGAVDFGGQDWVRVAEDPTGDSPGAGSTGPLGLDATGLFLRVPDSQSPTVEFRIPVTEISNQPPPEVVRYNWQFRLNEKEYWVQAKRSDLSGGTTTADDPQGAVTHPTGAFRLRGNCQTVGVVATCNHVAWIQGEFDPTRNEVRMWVPLGTTPDFAPGVVIEPEDGMSASLQAGISNASTSDVVAQEEPFTIPSKQVMLGVAAAGTDPGQVQYTVAATIAANGSFTGTVGSVGPGQAVFAKACFGGKCGTRSVTLG